MENVKHLLKENNINEALNNLIEQIKLDEINHRNEIKELKNEIINLKNKINKLENQNKHLLKENNIKLVNEYSEKLIEFLDNENLDLFKNIIEELNYPINEYISHTLKDISNMNLLHYSIEIDAYDFIYYLINKDADVNLPEKKDYWSPLMLAIKKRNYKIVKLLLDFGANVNYKDIVFFFILFFLGRFYTFGSFC